ncbi:hypothetical protein [Streptomyces sp. SYP-A7185]
MSLFPGTGADLLAFNGNGAFKGNLAFDGNLAFNGKSIAMNP